MNKLLAWAGVVIGMWSLTNSGKKSVLFVLMVFIYIAIVFVITFMRGGKTLANINIDEDFSQPSSS